MLAQEFFLYVGLSSGFSARFGLKVRVFLRSHKLCSSEVREMDLNIMLKLLPRLPFGNPKF